MYCAVFVERTEQINVAVSNSTTYQQWYVDEQLRISHLPKNPVYLKTITCKCQSPPGEAGNVARAHLKTIRSSMILT